MNDAAIEYPAIAISCPWLPFRIMLFWCVCMGIDLESDLMTANDVELYTDRTNWVRKSAPTISFWNRKSDEIAFGELWLASEIFIRTFATVLPAVRKLCNYGGEVEEWRPWPHQCPRRLMLAVDRPSVTDVWWQTIACVLNSFLLWF